MDSKRMTIDGETVYICGICAFMHDGPHEARACCRQSVEPEKVYPPRQSGPRLKVEPYPESVFQTDARSY